MNFSAPFILRPIGTTLLAAGLFLLGATAYFELPVASLPAVDFPTLRVQASRPGADPQTMAATIAAPIEKRLGEIAGVTELTSVSSQGIGQHLGAVRPVARRRRCRARRAGGAECRHRRSAGRSSRRADVPQVQSFRGAGAHPRHDVEEPDGERHLRRRRHGRRPAHLAGAGRGAGRGQRRRAAGGARARQPDAARLHGI